MAQKEADEAMMRETIATLERQEREREEKVRRRGCKGWHEST